jgi:hypothetical protein
MRLASYRSERNMAESERGRVIGEVAERLDELRRYL